MKIANFIRNELSGWKTWEVLWLVFCCAVILGLSLSWGDSPIATIAAITGIACVVCTGKGKLSAYLFGLINVITYAIIAYETRFYGEVMLNVLYYLPMQFYGFYVWSHHMNSETHEVEKRRMSRKGLTLLLIGIAVSTIVYGIFLQAIGGYLGFLDAFTTVVSIITLIISIKMYTEQWLLWIIVDSVSVVMWGIAFAAGTGHISTLMMWAIYLVNGVVMYIKWLKETKPKGSSASQPAITSQTS